MAPRPARPALTADQKIDAALLEAAAGDLRTLAATLAAATDATIFGATEFAVRDLVLRSGATAVEVAAADRAKTMTTGAAARAPPATGRPSSTLAAANRRHPARGDPPDPPVFPRPAVSGRAQPARHRPACPLTG